MVIDDSEITIEEAEEHICLAESLKKQENRFSGTAEAVPYKEE